MPKSSLKFSITIIDDEKVLADILKEEISHVYSQSQITVFNDPHEAIEFLKRNTMDLIITDGKMPGMSGVELAKNLQKENVKAAFFLITGHIDYLEDVKKEGIFNQVFEKPVDYDDLLGAVRLTVSTSQPEA